ncbi:Outer membrane efflux protein [Aquisphaera giovannonii]|uniref:Outer membrane efflux protein n=1 Tax=Aquisphaera giovannonii TaxID=406548 RepID=A0A5B9WA58_9BACT|nr:TolC family protein [Aquisphaera giovannonii]QEH37327.1 Outer membrane efflux protein [Aquisphaera giovannonii]
MRLTLSTNRWTPAALAAVWLFSAGCQRLPYIDQSKQVPHDNMGKIAQEDREVKQADFLSSTLPMQLPKVAKPRTTNDPEAQELWPLTLQEAIRIGLDNAEVIRVINLGAQGIPIEGFEPTFLAPALAAGSAGQAVLGGGGLASVYDPALQETQIAQALSVFDTAFTTQINWGRATQPFNNAIQGGSLTLTGPRTAVVSQQDTVNYQFGLQKRGATGTQMSIVHNINWLYQNSTFLVTPSAYTTNLQMSVTQPLLGSAPLPGQPINNFSNLVGLEANRAPIVIARLQADESVWNFKLNVMEHVRSIEQQYWILARKHVQLWSSEKAVDLAREIVNREQAELVVGKGTVADVAEAQQRLEQFSLELVTRTSDLITTERQLRNLLGLPPADNRRIVPVTPPTEARLEPDWDSSVAQMLSFYPDIVRQQIAVRVAELQLVIARNQLLPQLNLNLLYQLNGLGQQLDQAEAVMTGATIKALEPVVAARERAAGLPGNPGLYNNFHTWQVGFTFQMPLGNRSPLANTRYAQYGLLRQRAFLQQMVHQRLHQLARYYLEIDANYKQFKTASRLRAAAAQRLDAQRAYYEEGRITIDRFLDAVSQYAQAVATEAEWKTLYNISIIVFEESKGTLLAYNNIAVAEGPLPRKAYVQARDIQNAHRKLPIPHDGPMYNPPASGPVSPDSTPPADIPGVNPLQSPAMPAPVGPLGPPPTPAPPFRPAGEPPILSQKPAGEVPGALGIPTSPTGAPSLLTGTRPAADASTIPASAPAMPPSAPAAGPSQAPALPPLPPAASAEPAPSAPAGAQSTEELPELPADIGLPPLPKS